MAPNNEHAFYAWLIVIGAVCIVTVVGAVIDRFFLNRRLQRHFDSKPHNLLEKGK